jgi:chromosome segregation ATPase
MRESKLAYLTTRNTQLQNDLDAARKHRQVAERELADCRHSLQSANALLTGVNEDRNNWLLAFKTLAKLVK